MAGEASGERGRAGRPRRFGVPGSSTLLSSGAMLTIPAHPRCPNCDYDLHGLPGARCPECGMAVNLVALMQPRRSAFEPYGLRLALMAAVMLFAVPMGISIIAVVHGVAGGDSIRSALRSVPDAAWVTFFALPYWRPSAILMSVAIAAAIALFAAALTPRRRWYLALLGVLLIDAAWIVSVWCGVQVFMNI